MKDVIPPADDEFARRFIEAVRNGDYPVAEQMLDETIVNDQSHGGLQGIHEILAKGEAISVEPINYEFRVFKSYKGTTRTANLSYQVHNRNFWTMGNVLLSQQEEKRVILGTNFQAMPHSLKTINRFRLDGSTPVYYMIFLAGIILVPLFILFTLVVCIRSRVRRKWLWIIFILFGISKFRLDWTSGNWDIQALAISLLGAGYFRSGTVGPWILTFGVPLGAILFLVCRNLLVRGKLETPPVLPPTI